MIGAILVGFAIGMMVAFAELAFRRYWLEVAFGKHEIRTITLGSTPVTIGTDANAMIQIDAPKPITLAFRIDDDRVVCRNVHTDKTFDVRPGHEARIGTVSVTMRSAEQARKLGYALCLSNDDEISLTEGMPLHRGGVARPRIAGRRRHGAAGQRASARCEEAGVAQSLQADMERA